MITKRQAILSERSIRVARIGEDARQKTSSKFESLGAVVEVEIEAKAGPFGFNKTDETTECESEG